ncbi:L-aspartate oxidase domain protein [Mycobacterium xenopi 4042]|uniref:L-aspartate oxidase domain protein n=1 Tax=Mycobacterium xenopi 4042 TaxID=1299334 RepID=X8DL66_MYCXE|nr:L-aspartate oxidase domain protein [Mycobacterium xenopi 4042]
MSDLEFIQFHPTMLFGGLAGGRRPLVTEAIRGEVRHWLMPKVFR